MEKETHTRMGPADARVPLAVGRVFAGALLTAESERYRDIHVIISVTRCWA